MRDHELVEAVLGLTVAAHQVERQPARAPRDEGQEPPHGATGVVGGDDDAAPVRAVTKPVEGHRESALGLVAAPLVGEPREFGQFVVAQFVVAAYLGRVAAAFDAGDGLADGTHRAPAQGEGVGVDDGLVTERPRLEPRLDVGARSPRAGGEDGGVQPVLAALAEPHGDGVVPGLSSPDGVGGRDADAPLVAERDGGAAVGGEDDGLVPTRGEIPQGVVLAVLEQETADAQFLVGVDQPGAAARTPEDEQREDEDEGRHRARDDEGPFVPLVPSETRAGRRRPDAERAADRPDELLPEGVEITRERQGEQERDDERQEQTSDEADECRRLRAGTEPRSERGACEEHDDERRDTQSQDGRGHTRRRLELRPVAIDAAHVETVDHLGDLVREHETRERVQHRKRLITNQGVAEV